MTFSILLLKIVSFQSICPQIKRVIRSCPYLAVLRFWNWCIFVFQLRQTSSFIDLNGLHDDRFTISGIKLRASHWRQPELLHTCQRFFTKELEFYRKYYAYDRPTEENSLSYYGEHVISGDRAAMKCFQKLFGNVNDYKVSKFEACYKEYFGLQYSAFYLFVQAWNVQFCVHTVTLLCLCFCTYILPLIYFPPNPV